MSFCAASIERSNRGLAKYEMFVLPTARIDAAVEQLVDERVRVAVIRPRDHVGEIEARAPHAGERELAEARRRVDPNVQPDLLQRRGDDDRTVLAVLRAAREEHRVAAAQVAAREAARRRKVGHADRIDVLRLVAREPRREVLVGRSRAALAEEARERRAGRARS